ncbi:hypothetical protein [Streptomyces sp. BSE6.1]|uniref:hypothetical protein n=1 Tax=Streptomyces sp. BSE6.1 TaxID=2605730 RepID=UPI001F1A0E41|nr:hypothetical protein [Streptomyces sp. BSE6.1]
MSSKKPADYCRTERLKARGRLAALARARDADDPDVVTARRKLAAIKARGLLLAALDELTEATNPDAPDLELPLSLCREAADEVGRQLQAAAG